MLIERVKADDADALNTIYEAYVPMMRKALKIYVFLGDF